MRKQKKKVLLLGGGVGQLYLAEKLHKEGIDFIVIAYNVLEEFRVLAQKVILHDLFDLEGVLAIAKEEKVDAVISDQTDIYIPTVAYVAEHLNLPGNTYDQVNCYCDKNKFRTICDKLNVPVPKHVELKSITDYYFENPPFAFPMMIKPADMQASVGVVKVDNLIDYKKGIVEALNLSRSNSAIIEEFFEGYEVVCEGLIQNGKYFNLGFADRKYFDIPSMFIPCQTVFPSGISQNVKEQIILFESVIAKEVNPTFAIVHSEYLWSPVSNEIRCVESALRGGGVFISSHLIPLYTGLDVNQLLIDFVLGNKPQVKDVINKKAEKASAYVCFYLPEGVIERIDGVDMIEKMPEIDMFCLSNLRIGDETHRMIHKGNRYGPIIAHAENIERMNSVIQTVQQNFKVYVRDAEGKVRTQIWQ